MLLVQQSVCASLHRAALTGWSQLECWSFHSLAAYTGPYSCMGNHEVEEQ